MRYQEVFVPGGFPRHTYNPRIDLQLEQKLAEARDNLCKLVTVTGQTKSGKTVLAKKVFPREEAVWVDGGIVSTEDDFWQSIVEQLNLFQGTEYERSTDLGGGIDGKGSTEASIIVAKGKAELGAHVDISRGTATKVSQTISSRVVAIRGLTESRIPLVVDDFHYIPRDMQGGIVRALKPLVFEGLPVVIIAIPHRRYDAMKVEKEMTGRISAVDIPPWSQTELQYIPDTGFALLGHTASAELTRELASQSIGSPHLMQDFCRGLCSVIDLQPSYLREDVELPVSRPQIETVYRNVAENIGRPMFEKLARGPRQRSDRLPRLLKGGQTVDIYKLVLLGLAHLSPGLISIEYEELRAAIREVSSGAIPQLQEIARVLKHMSTIAATDQSSTPVLDFEEEDKKLHVTDPFFAFYLRWGELTGAENDAEDAEQLHLPCD
jgi:hypothetical protein